MELLITCSQTYVMQCWRPFGFSQETRNWPKTEFSVDPGVEFLNRRTRSHRARRKNAPHRHARERQPRTQACKGLGHLGDVAAASCLVRLVVTFYPKVSVLIFSNPFCFEKTGKMSTFSLSTRIDYRDYPYHLKYSSPVSP